VSKTHDLKTWPEPFEAVFSWRKEFEIRKNDRDFAEGDILVLREWTPDGERYTGRKMVAEVKYILRDEVLGKALLQPNVVAMGIEVFKRFD
jgi:hypothetical protein